MSAIKDLFGGTITATLPTELIDASYVLSASSTLPRCRPPLHSETFAKCLIPKKSFYLLILGSASSSRS